MPLLDDPLAEVPEMDEAEVRRLAATPATHSALPLVTRSGEAPAPGQAT
jgi:hypothetical protein